MFKNEFSKLFILVLMLIFIVTLVLVNNNYINQLNLKHQAEINLYINKLKKAETDNKVKIELIKEKVKIMNDFIKRLYPYYNYNYIDSVNKVIDNMEDKVFTDELNNIPSDLMQIYYQQYLMANHGIENKYTLRYPELCFPLEIKSTCIAVQGGEFGMYRGYTNYYYITGTGENTRYITNCHEGSDLVNNTNQEIYAPYNSEITKTYTTIESGLIVELKYYNIERNQYCFDRFMHCSIVNVKVGEKVKKGLVIAQLGKTGTFSTENHCHYEHWIWDSNLKIYTDTNIFMNSTWGNQVINKIYSRY